MQFQIVVEFPINEFIGDNFIGVTGEKIHPESLKEAIAFVMLNEEKFAEVFFNSRPRPEHLDQEISESEFQKL